MKNSILKSLGLWSAAGAALCGGLVHTASAQPACPLVFQTNTLSAYVTAYPGYNYNLTQPLVSLFTVDVTTPGQAIPVGLYPGWCCDEQDNINTAYITVPGTLETGTIYSTCDPLLNTELPAGHPGTIVTPVTWSEVNYILNNQSGYFYYDVLAALNTLVGAYTNNMPTPSGLVTSGPGASPYPYPSYNPANVAAILAAAAANGTNFTPVCGDVYGAIFVSDPTTNQFILIEVPVPCSESLSVNEQIACLQPANNCGGFEGSAGGYIGTNAPAFCYQIVVSNSGNVVLSNIVVEDSLLGNIASQFVPPLPSLLQPGASATALFKTAQTATTTNIVTATAAADVSEIVATSSAGITNGQPVSSSSQAVAVVAPASISCAVNLYAAIDFFNHTNAAAVLLPSASYYATNPAPPLLISVEVYNTGSANLSGVTIASSALQSLTGCTLPAPFSLGAGKSTNIQLCSTGIACPGLTFSVNVGGDAAADSGHCAIYDITSSNLIGVSSACVGSVSCIPAANLSGAIYYHCNPSTPVSVSDSPLAGVTVKLLASDDATVLATTSTAANGAYSFTGLAPGVYYVAVTAPAGDSETYPASNGNGRVAITIVGTTSAVQNFGYANSSVSAITLTGVPTGSALGCNPSIIPTDASISNLLHVADICCTASFTVSHLDATNSCAADRVFTISATDTCGDTLTTNVTYTWTVPLLTTLTNITTNTTYSTNITVTTNCCTNTICGSFNSQNPGSGWVWCNAHLSGSSPGKPCTVYCQNATITLSCNDGKTYTFPVPNGKICFSTNCTTATNWFDGTNWNTTLPCSGDSEVFLQGCAIPWQSDFANCQSVCWTGVFSCDTAGQSFGWTWGASCYNNAKPSYGSIAPKACLNTSCKNGLYYNSGDHAGTPENCSAYCVGGGTCAGNNYGWGNNYGGNNYTGSWCGTGYTCTSGFTTNITITTNKTYITNTTTIVQPPVLTGVPVGKNLGSNPTNIPTVASLLAEISASATCSQTTLNVTVADSTNSCNVTQVFTITATNTCGGSVTDYVTNTWNTTTPVTNTICCNFNSQTPKSGWLWCNSQVSCSPGQNCDIYCQGGSITITGNSGKVYTYSVPNCHIVFTNTCSAATNWFDGTNWNTCLPTSGDNGIFLSGCSIPCNADFANCQNACWQGTFTCSTHCALNWQWGAACYSGNTPSCGSVSVKACQYTSCGYDNYNCYGDQAGTPENCKYSFVGDCTASGGNWGGNNNYGGGGSNWGGSPGGKGSCSF